MGIEVLIRDPREDIVTPWFVLQDAPLQEDIVEKLDRVTESPEKPVVAGALGEPHTQETSRTIEVGASPVLRWVRNWILAARRLASNVLPWQASD